MRTPIPPAFGYKAKRLAFDGICGGTKRSRSSQLSN